MFALQPVKTGNQPVVGAEGSDLLAVGRKKTLINVIKQTSS